MSKGPEAQVQRLILDWLTTNRIWHMRLNTGAMSGSHNGKKWFVKFGKPGMGDILATPHNPIASALGLPMPRIVWIEVKAEKGKQSEAQLLFQKEVEEQGHRYVLARSLDDVVAALGEN